MPSTWADSCLVTSILDPYALRGRTFRNRLWVPAMCMYSVDAGDGVPDEFHLAHYASRAAGGYGLIISEATAVVPEGRISLADTGLWSDAQAASWRRITSLVHAVGGAIGVQLGHAGRKASTWPMRPNAPSGSVPVGAGGWTTVGPSASGFPGNAAPRALSQEEIPAIVQTFVDATRRAASAGFDVVELHAAHGYLLHQFLSPLSNQRTDAYGGSLQNRMRLTLEVTEAVRAEWPADRPLFVRVSATDWLDGGWDVANTCALVGELKGLGVDLIDVSSGGLLPASVPVGPGYQVGLAGSVRAVGLPTAAVGLITSAVQGQRVLDAGAADAVLFGRESLRDPVLPLRYAESLGRASELRPLPYFRAY